MQDARLRIHHFETFIRYSPENYIPVALECFAPRLENAAEAVAFAVNADDALDLLVADFVARFQGSEALKEMLYVRLRRDA